jgi:hypothetical protein
MRGRVSSRQGRKGAPDFGGANVVATRETRIDEIAASRTHEPVGRSERNRSIGVAQTAFEQVHIAAARGRIDRRIPFADPMGFERALQGRNHQAFTAADRVDDALAQRFALFTVRGSEHVRAPRIADQREVIARAIFETGPVASRAAATGGAVVSIAAGESERLGGRNAGAT